MRGNILTFDRAVTATAGRVRGALLACCGCTALLAGCAALPIVQPRGAPDGDVAGAPAPAARARDAVPAHPLEAAANGARAENVRRQALAARGMRIAVSTEARALWLLRDDEIVFAAPVAVGMHEPFFYGGRRYDFTTPIGTRRVLAKSPAPIWVPPDWHYYEKAAARGLQPVHLRAGSRVALSDGTRLEVRGRDVGRVNQHGNFWAFTPGMEIIFDDRIFIPPFGTRQREIDEVLGTHKLELGDGYLIHGTNDDDSIGDAVSHGCVRMYNDDVAQLYALVPVGTRVYVF